MYDPKSMCADDFIDHQEILDTLSYADEHKSDVALIDSIIAKAKERKGLSHRDASVLLACDIPGKESRRCISSGRGDQAGVLRQPHRHVCAAVSVQLLRKRLCLLSVSCEKHSHIARKKLTQEEVAREVIALQDMGHKRLAIEAGEDPVNNPIEYILECINTIYSIKHKNGAIRRVNVNIAATTVENYRKLKDAGIGTYILFQETYHKQSYLKLHPTGPKHDYDYHTEAMDRAMEGGIDDVGLGVLFGLEHVPATSSPAFSCTPSIWRPYTAWARTPSACRVSSVRTILTRMPSTTAIDDDAVRKDRRLHPHCRAVHRHDHLHPREPAGARAGACIWVSRRSAAASRT